MSRETILERPIGVNITIIMYDQCIIILNDISTSAGLYCSPNKENPELFDANSRLIHQMITRSVCTAYVCWFSWTAIKIYLTTVLDRPECKKTDIRYERNEMFLRPTPPSKFSGIVGVELLCLLRFFSME